jgi:N-acetylmuramic acid 6-phosphate etherase
MDQSSKPADVDLIPDRGRVLTEARNPRTTNLDTLNVADCVALLNDEDATVAAAVRRSAPAMVAFIEAVELRWRKGGRLIYLGAGTSGRLGVLDAAECPPTFQTDPERIIAIIAGGDQSLRTSSEGMEDDEAGAMLEINRLNIGELDSVLGIAAGGTTPFVLGALKECKKRGALTGLLACSPPMAMTGADHLILVETGPEAVTGSTRMKAATATKLVLNTISTTLMVQVGKVYENLMVDLRATNNKLLDRAVRIVCEVTGLDRAAGAKALEKADGSVKVAILMTLTGMVREDAHRRLDQADGSLREALDRERTQ